ncbi:uncharacterized protein IWZ02DRAFT_454999 [Phyllosticta citriasiana]|uniref:uncharacterized protein n=1 Tax=Phyllosticta citriasiana TaxID=595635 RepID=UPI0030FD3E3C
MMTMMMLLSLTVSFFLPIMPPCEPNRASFLLALSDFVLYRLFIWTRLRCVALRCNGNLLWRHFSILLCFDSAACFLAF